MKDLKKKLKKAADTTDVLEVIEQLIDFVEEICIRVVDLESELEKFKKIPANEDKGFFHFSQDD